VLCLYTCFSKRSVNVCFRKQKHWTKYDWELKCEQYKTEEKLIRMPSA
jgi:hypothetical protein